MGKWVWVHGERTRTHYIRWVLFFPLTDPWIQQFVQIRTLMEFLPIGFGCLAKHHAYFQHFLEKRVEFSGLVGSTMKSHAYRRLDRARLAVAGCYRAPDGGGWRAHRHSWPLPADHFPLCPSSWAHRSPPGPQAIPVSQARWGPPGPFITSHKRVWISSSRGSRARAWLALSQ
jgi:hypothetical protein